MNTFLKFALQSSHLEKKKQIIPTLQDSGGN